MTANPGDVFELPADLIAGEDENKEARPHVVLTRPESLGRTATLVYCSTQDTEARVKPPPAYMAVLNRSDEGRLAGFKSSRPYTYLYPSRLVLAMEGDIPPESKVGIVPDLLTQLRDEVLPRALGIGQGTTRAAGPALGSQRGAVAELTTLGQEDIGSRYVLVVSEAGYARAGNFWNVIPLMSRGNRQAEDPDFTVNGDLDWVIALGGIQDDVILFVRMVRAIYRRTYVHTLHLGADPDTIEKVDRALLRHFGVQESI